MMDIAVLTRGTAGLTHDTAVELARTVELPHDIAAAVAARELALAASVGKILMAQPSVVLDGTRFEQLSGAAGSERESGKIFVEHRNCKVLPTTQPHRVSPSHPLPWLWILA